MNEKDYQKTVQDLREKAQDEIDKLLVYLSSGGLLLSITVIDNIIDINDASYKWMLIFSWWSFVVSLLLTLTSHMTSKKSMTLYLQGKTQKSDSMDTITRMINWFSILTLICGLILCILFVTKNI